MSALAKPIRDFQARLYSRPEKIGRNYISVWDTYHRTWYYPSVEYPFPPVGIVGAADGKNRRAFLRPQFKFFFSSESS